MENLNGEVEDYEEEKLNQQELSDDKCKPHTNYRETFSQNNSFARSDVIEKQKSFTHSSSEITWKYANFLGGTQEDNID